MDTLINLSGGVDSTYALWQHLKEGHEAKLLVLHVKMKNWEARIEHEHKAVQDILQWLNAQGLTNYQYIESGFDYGDIYYIIPDIQIAGFMDGIVMRRPRWRGINNIIVSANKEDFDDPTYKKRAQRRHELVEFMSLRKPNFIYPIKDMTKADLVHSMPPDLFKLCWWCRKPVAGRACGRCKPCMAISKI